MEIAVPDASLRWSRPAAGCCAPSRIAAPSPLDRRVVTQRYGKAILNALPPFRREIA
jgi:ATP-dependent DNA helicase DinG